MRQIEVQIPTKKAYKSFIRSVPEKWNELNQNQLLRAMEILFGVQDKHQQNRLLLHLLLDLPPYVFRALPLVSLLELYPLTSFLKETNNLTTQLLPMLRLSGRHGFRKLYGAGELLVNLSFAEFITTEKHFLRWQKTGDAKNLHQLVATLYRPRRYFHRLRKLLGDYAGDIRTPFNEHLVEERSRPIASLPEAQLLAILTWYRGCRQALENFYPNIFSAEKEESGESGSAGWEPVLRGMSGGKFGDFEKTKRVQAHSVLKEMDAQIKQAKDMALKNQRDQS